MNTGSSLGGPSQVSDESSSTFIEPSSRDSGGIHTTEGPPWNDRTQMPHSLPSQHGYKQGKSRRAGNLTPSGPLLAVSRGAGSVDADHPRRCVHGRVGPEPPRPIGPPEP